MTEFSSEYGKPDKKVDFEGITYYVLAKVGYSTLLVITEDDFVNNSFPYATYVIPDLGQTKLAQEE